MATTACVLPALRRALIQRGSIDIPNHRSSHAAPIPRGGGLACAAGVALGIMASGEAGHFPPRMFIGLTTLTGIGLADDQLGNVHYIARLSVQAIAGALFAKTIWLIPFTSLGTAGVVNVINFMDGINGITGTTAAVWGISTFLAGTSADDPILTTLGTVTAGAGLGFLPWNVPTAQLFLGDVGSYLFGALMAAGIAHCADRPTLAWRVAAPLLPYGLDAAQAIIRRAIDGKNLSEGHRDHVYQQLVDQHQLTHVQTSMLHAATATTVAVVAARRRSLTGFTAVVTALVNYLFSPELLRRLSEKGLRHDRRKDVPGHSLLTTGQHD